MGDTQTRACRLGDVFPAHSPVARILFRLAILREDLRLEILASSVPQLHALSSNDPWHARAYFIRRMTQTLTEFGRILFAKEHGEEVVVRELRAYIGRDPEKERRASYLGRFDDGVSRLRAALDTLEDVRNNAGVHLDRKRCAEVLAAKADMNVPFHVSDSLAENYYGVPRVALYLCLPQALANEPSLIPGFSTVFPKLQDAGRSANLIVDTAMAYRLHVEGVFRKGRALKDASELEGSSS